MGVVSLFTMWDPGFEPKLSGLLASAFTTEPSLTGPLNDLLLSNDYVGAQLMRLEKREQTKAPTLKLFKVYEGAVQCVIKINHSVTRARGVPNDSRSLGNTGQMPAEGAGTPSSADLFCSLLRS